MGPWAVVDSGDVWSNPKLLNIRPKGIRVGEAGCGPVVDRLWNWPRLSGSATCGQSERVVQNGLVPR
jgi:hypothetical protein